MNNKITKILKKNPNENTTQNYQSIHQDLMHITVRIFRLTFIKFWNYIFNLSKGFHLRITSIWALDGCLYFRIEFTKNESINLAPVLLPESLNLPKENATGSFLSYKRLLERKKSLISRVNHKIPSKLSRQSWRITLCAIRLRGTCKSGVVISVLFPWLNRVHYYWVQCALARV